jgi:hypothetical protein
MALSEEEKSRAAAIVDRWFWQIDESRQYRYKDATQRLVRFYESAPLSADVFDLVLEYLSTMEGVEEIQLNHKKVVPGGKWNALAAWYATAPGEKWAGSESAKVRIYQALILAREKESDKAGEHQLTGMEHRDVVQTMLPDDSKFEVEPEVFELEDVVIGSPLKNNEGFSDAEDQVGGETRKIVHKRAEIDPESGRIEQRLTEQTAVPYKKTLAWEDSRSDHTMLVFRNQKVVPTLPQDTGSLSVSLAINEFGLFDGIFHGRNDFSTGGSDDEWGGQREQEITIKERYVRPGGRTFVRTYKVVKHIFHGDASGAVNHVLEGTEYPALGLRSTHRVSGQRGMAVWYTDLTLQSDAPEES